MGSQLKKRYGVSSNYTAGQIKTTVEHAGLRIDYIRYGYAMYMDKDGFDTLHRELDKQCDYESMRQEIADLCFSGDKNFSAENAIAFSEIVGGVFGGSKDHSGSLCMIAPMESLAVSP